MPREEAAEHVPVWGSGSRRRAAPGWRTASATLIGALVLVVTAASSTATARLAGRESGSGHRAGGPTSAGTALHHGMVDVDGASLHYVRGGSGPPLLLLHGWPQTWWAWNDVLTALASERTVIAIDLPGLGDSGVPVSGYDKVTTARRIRQAVQKLGYHQVEIVGHDVGALVAYPYARDYPTEVRRLVVVETPLSGFGLEDFYRFRWHFLFNATPAPIPERIIDNDDVSTYLGMFFDGAQHPERIDDHVYFRAYADPLDRHAGYEYYRAFSADAADNRANAGRRLQMPVLAMGAQAVFGPAVAASFRQVADDVRQVVVPDSGHFVPEENAPFFIDCVKLFLGTRSGPTPAELSACAA